MRHRTAALVVVLLVLMIPVAIAVASTTSGSRCDSYGDCVNPTIVPSVHSNPDGTFYPGDSFTFSMSPTLGANMTVSAVNYQYDATEFSESGGHFTITGNKTGAFTIVGSVEFRNSSDISGSNSSGVYSALSGTGTITVDRLVITPDAFNLVNVTASNGQLLRNADGSFYRNDTFCVNWSSSFQYYLSRPDINITVNPGPGVPLRIENSTVYKNNYSGKSCFAVTDSAGYQPYKLVLGFNAVNGGRSIAHVYYTDLSAPFTVVQYSPYFAHYTYMVYDNLNSTSYQRPFATVVRYDGNNPGFASNYAGDADTAPIKAVNDTNERAWINNFTFSVTGYRMLANESSHNVNSDVAFQPVDNTNVTIRYMNATALSQTREMNWGNRYYKYYFIASSNILNDVYGNRSIPYFNVDQYAQSNDYAGGNYTVFRSTYVYNPILLNGNLTFRGYGPGGKPDQNMVVDITLVNPSPLNVVVLQEVNSTFNHDPRADLYVMADLSSDAYNYTETLIPTMVNNTAGTYMFRINQTSIFASSSGPTPYLKVSVHELVGGVLQMTNYTVNIPFTQYMIPSSLFPTAPHGSLPSPFNTTLAYYVDQLSGAVGSPMNLTSSQRTSLYMYSPNQNVPLPGPYTFPGNLTSEYAFLFGQNNTVPVNMLGGGVGLVQLQNFSSSSYRTTAFSSSNGGGVTQYWVGSISQTPTSCSTGTSEMAGGYYVCKIFTFIPTYDTSPLLPPAYLGVYSFDFSVPNGTYAVGYDGAWGVHGIITTFTNNAVSPGAPDGWGLLTLAGGFTIFVYFLGRWAKYRRSNIGSSGQ